MPFGHTPGYPERKAAGQTLRTLARLRHMRLAEIPQRAREQLRWLADPILPPRAVRAGPCPRLPLEVPPAPHPPEEPQDGWLEPVSGYRWPMIASFRIDALSAPADARLSWERSRLQGLAALAERGSARGWQEALAWVQDNPVGVGLGWRSSLEAALRIVSLLRIGARKELPWLRAAVYDHAAFVAAHPSEGSSLGNHRAAELAALRLAGVALAERRFVEESLALSPVLEQLVHADGSGVEQSVSYLAFTLEWALLARALGAPGLDAAISRAARFLTAILPPSGIAAALGDDDNGRVIPLPGDEDHYVRSIAGACALTLGLPVPSGYLPDARAALFGLSGRPIVEQPPRSRLFPEGGLTVLASDGIHVVFDHGPLGGCSLAAHGHADALSVYIDAGGPVVTSRGTGQYCANPSARRFHRGTPSHPTVVVDGRSQSAQHPSGHPFLWASRAVTTLERADLASGEVSARCKHATAPVEHARTVTLRGRRLQIEDEIRGSGRHHIRVTFPLAEGLSVGDDLVIVRDQRPIGQIIPDARCVVTALRGGERPGLGWHAPRYGVWVESSAVVCEIHAALPAHLRTVISFW